jgi:predicted Zn-dependent protease
MRNLGLAAFQAGEHSESARALARVVEAEPGDRASRVLLAMSLASVARWPEAVAAFDALGDAAFDEPRVAYLWALSLARSGRPDDARRVLDRLREQPLPPEALLRLAALYEELGDAGSAAELRGEAEAVE